MRRDVTSPPGNIEQPPESSFAPSRQGSRLQDALISALAQKAQTHTRRFPRAMQRSREGLALQGRTLVDLSSNDYLGLSQHPLLRERAASWAARFGTGAGASRLVTGTLELHLALEEKLARFKNCEAALLFATGWQANASILPALDQLSRLQTGHEARMFCDRLNHASLHHGCAAAGVHQKRFRHNDLGHLRQLLEQHTSHGGLSFIVTESVFSMDGDRADLAGLRALADEFGAFLYVDEAHATGILGPGGTGLAGALADLAVHTASKALGGMGAFVCGSSALCAWLFNQASGLVYSTALPPTVLGAMDAALELVPHMERERQHVARLAADLRRVLEQRGFGAGPSTTQIVPLIIGENATALALAEKLEKAGFLAMPIRPPTVPHGTARLRFSLHAGLREEQLEALVSCLPSGPFGRQDPGLAKRV
ncbi:aminotransferase class I/II-fold pyridoxal phosphate-dependent enzyme [Oecophyllibacter saccharovorans]|uniref:aminotransferase class I/II-fold pyridoxal phosphate-dependent enzyme n=1 Tax=Oecophyllibacter saccharovorans TaxID=2558360 RepID=UPI001E50B887|nr:8-amino-7-oxononanoate synthase [Oecophyllibacter saccharovorans]